MEIRLRSSVSRTAKGYSVEATLDISGDAESRPLAEQEDLIDLLSSVEIAKLQEHMKALGEAFPREDA